jgi:hypothetical protein
MYSPFCDLYGILFFINFSQLIINMGVYLDDYIPTYILYATKTKQKKWKTPPNNPFVQAYPCPCPAF